MINKIKTFFSKLRGEDGVTAIEYALLAALVAVAIIGGATLLGNTINSELSSIANKL